MLHCFVELFHAESDGEHLVDTTHVKYYQSAKQHLENKARAQAVLIITMINNLFPFLTPLIPIHLHLLPFYSVFKLSTISTLQPSLPSDCRSPASASVEVRLQKRTIFSCCFLSSSSLSFSPFPSCSFWYLLLLLSLLFLLSQYIALADAELSM